VACARSRVSPRRPALTCQPDIEAGNPGPDAADGAANPADEVALGDRAGLGVAVGLRDAVGLGDVVGLAGWVAVVLGDDEAGGGVGLGETDTAPVGAGEGVPAGTG
jgi:hypothetical protein